MYSVRQRTELMGFHDSMFPRYSVFALDDEISHDDSVSRIGSSQISGSLAHLAELATQKKYAVLQQQLHEAEAESEQAQAERVQAEAEWEMCARDAEVARKIGEAKAQIELAGTEAEIERKSL